MRHSFGFSMAIALLALVSAGKAILYDTLDPDCFWHLRVAEQLQRDGVGPLVDEISFASTKSPWTPYSWLAELGMKALWDTGGWRAAVLAQALMMAGFVVLVALAARGAIVLPPPLRGEGECVTRHVFGGELRVVLAAAFAMYWALPYLSFRPATFAIVALAACAWLAMRDRRLGERSRAIWLLVPICALLANVHFFVFLVPLALSAHLIDAHSRKRQATLVFATLAASCATPMLPGVLRAIAQYQFADPTLSAGFIAEFQPFYAGPAGWLSVSLLLGATGLAIWNRAALRAVDGILLLGGIALLLRLGRFAPIYAIVAAPILARTLPALRDGVLQRRPILAALSLLLLIGVARLAIGFPRAGVALDQWLNRHGPDTPGYPTGAAEFVEANIEPATGRLINEFTWGGYLAWRLGDRYQVLMDGRTQLYPPEFWNAYAQRGRAGQAMGSSHFLADAAVLPGRRSRLRDELVSRGWRAVHADDRAEVLVPPIASSDAE